MNGRHQIDETFFRDPSQNPDNCLCSFWFWNDLITDEKTAEQLRMMNRSGVRQATIHARFGLQNQYLSEDWFDRIASCVEAAKDSGMKLWLYDEDGWPSGNASWTITKDEEAREHFLEIRPVYLKAGETASFDTVKKTYLSIAACAGTERNELLDGRKAIDFTADTDTVLYPVEVRVDAYDELGKYSVDYMSRKQLRKFIDCTHEKYAARFQEEFGKTIRGIFMDETRFLNALPWTKDFPEEFKRRKGYDVVPLLYQLVTDGPESRAVRYDYYDVCADLMREATFQQIYDWAEEHGIQTTGHVLGEETLASQSRYNIDIMRQFSAFHLPGIDHLGNGIGSLDAKICSSAAHNYGRDIVNSESFGACGWGMTMEPLIKISNWLYQQGVNQHMMHGFYYSIRNERKNDWPPSYFYQWQDWDLIPQYADMAARMSYMLQGGVTETELLVYYPVETFWQHFQPDFEQQISFFKDGPAVRDEKAQFINDQFQLLCSTLLNKNLDFEIFNSDAAKNFRVEGKALVNSLTGARYTVLVLPVTEVLPEETARLLDTFTAAGAG